MLFHPRTGTAPGELGSYRAIVACGVAGSGVAIVPRSVLQVVQAGSEVQALPLPARVARARTWLAWRAGHGSVALEALREALRRGQR